VDDLLLTDRFNLDHKVNRWAAKFISNIKTGAKNVFKRGYVASA